MLFTVYIPPTTGNSRLFDILTAHFETFTLKHDTRHIVRGDLNARLLSKTIQSLEEKMLLLGNILQLPGNIPKNTRKQQNEACLHVFLSN